MKPEGSQTLQQSGSDLMNTIVRVMFQLATVGDGQGPMGVRAIAKWLNGRGHTLRGGRFYNSNVADILGRTHSIGYYLDGKKDDYGDPLPEAEWIRVPCPAIVELDIWQAAAALCAVRQPRATPPRIVNGVTMLPSAVARCAEPGCGAGPTVRSGKGGRYHYHNCEHRVNRDKEPAISARSVARRSTASSTRSSTACSRPIICADCSLGCSIAAKPPSEHGAKARHRPEPRGRNRGRPFTIC